MSGRPPSPIGRRVPIIQGGGRDTTSTSAYYEYPSTSRTSRDYVPGASREHGDTTRLVTIRQRSPPRRVHEDDYKDLPRIRTNSLDPGSSVSRRPVEAFDSRSPIKSTRPVIIRDSERPASPVSKTGGAQLEASYLIPASSSRHHHRHASFNGGERLSTRDRDREREKAYPGQYGPGSSLVPSRPVRDTRDYDAGSTLAPPQRRIRSGSHTGARPTSMIELERGEKAYARTDRDGPPSVSTRVFDSVNRKESLKSSNRDLGDDLTRKDSLSQRYPRTDRDDPKYRDLPPRTSKGSRDDYVVYPPEGSRHPRPRQPTLESDRDDRDHERPRRHRHHREEDARDYEDRHDKHRRREYDDRDENDRRRDYEERGDRDRDRERRRDYDDKYEKTTRAGYSEKDDRRKYPVYRDERERRRDYDEKDYRPRDEIRDTDRRSGKDDQSSSGHSDSLLAAGGAAAAAGLAAEEVRRHRSKGEDAVLGKERRGSYLPDRNRDRERDRLPEAPRAPGPAPTEEEEREERRRRRRREREQEDRYGTSAIDDSSDDRGEREPLRIEAAPPPPGEHSLREQKSYERRPGDTGTEEPSRRRRRRRRHHRSPSNDAASHSSSESDSSTEARTPRIISSPTEFPAEPPASRPAPKGILKRPKVSFPEDHEIEREGVAPLDAGKKGIPKEAKWTRINRKLVNPEALELEGVRFEEYADHVVVLKVLNKEDIDRYARRTHEIRERRRIEGGSQAGSGSGDGDGGDVPPLR